ncbi:MAG: hypothetical protein HY652_10135 [Acidobacteria bacterium]|nr:hypothetical protein [Acidobacteriota bacterium]
MRKSGRVILAMSIALLAIVLTGCPDRQRIADITADPGRYYDKEVTIAGEVTRSYGALGQGIYEIDDGTGHMWVFSGKYGVPSKEARVGATGRVIQGLTFAGTNYATVLRETRRRTHP